MHTSPSVPASNWALSGTLVDGSKASTITQSSSPSTAQSGNQEGRVRGVKMWRLAGRLEVNIFADSLEAGAKVAAEKLAGSIENGDGRYWVTVEGPDDKMRGDAGAFGVTPLV